MANGNQAYEQNPNTLSKVDTDNETNSSANTTMQSNSNTEPHDSSEVSVSGSTHEGPFDSLCLDLELAGLSDPTMVFLLRVLKDYLIMHSDLRISDRKRIMAEKKKRCDEIRAKIMLSNIFLFTLFGLIGTPLAIYGYSKGLWFHRTLLLEDDCGHIDECYHSMEYMCETLINEPLRESGASSYKLLSCPTRWLVIPQVFVFLIVWISAITLTCLYIFNGSVTNYVSSKYKRVFCVQTIYIVFGLVAIASGACLIAFSVFLVSGDDEDNCHNIWNIFRYQKLGTNSSLPVILAGWPYPNRDENDENSFRDRCLKDQAEFFYQNYILSGGVFAVLTGLWYIFVWLCARC